MTSILHFFNHWGEFHDTFDDLPTTPRSWVVNQYGRCEISIPLDHPAAKELYLRFGSFIHIEHVPSAEDAGKLPDWTGVILPPRNWTKDAIQLTAYSLEGIFAYRAMPFIDGIFGTPTEVFKKIIEYAQSRYPNNNAPFRFQPGRLDNSSSFYVDDLRTNAYDHIKKLVETAAMEWSATASLVPGSHALALFYNLKIRQVGWNGGALTPDNTEESDPLLSEQGVPYNQIFAYSQAQTAADRITTEVDNPDSIETYGPYQMNQIYTGATNMAGLTAAASAGSAQRGTPQRVFKRVALDVGNTFSSLRPGALVMVQDNRVGFNANGGFGFRDLVRILSMDYNDTSNKVTLNVEIIPFALRSLLRVDSATSTAMRSP